jgi:hypothetical protein
LLSLSIRRTAFTSMSLHSFSAPSGKLADSSRDVLRDVVRARAQEEWLARFTSPK